MQKDIRNKRLWYIAVIILFVFLIGIDIIKFRLENKQKAIMQETAISTTEERKQETILEESTEVKEGEDDDYKYQEITESTTQEKLVIEYEEFYEKFDTEGK